MKTFLFGFAVLFSIACIGHAAEEAPVEKQAGYVDFGELAEAYGEPRVMINIGSSLLRLVNAIKHEDPVAEQILRDMQSIRVHVYDTHGNLAPAKGRIDRVRSQLADDNWELIVHSREGGEQVEIFVKQDEVRIHGLAVMAVDSEEAVFINVLGSIDPEQLATVVAKLDVDVDLDL
ncbi:MAG: DUF4252 domain-containing protein [Halieaceae bacterium]|jgi:hypothetical protein|nr:DUF4252 domain-containing protein [Halieaceae bacterium]